MSQTAESKFITIEELAERWRTSPAGIHQARHRGMDLVGYRLGRRVLFRLDEVERFEATRVDPQPGA